LKILIIQTAFIGDVILATPLILELQKKHPTSEIHVLVRKGNESLLQNFPQLKKVLIWEKRNSKIQNLIKIIKEIRSEKFDIVYNLQRFFSSGLITVFSGAKNKIGFDKNPLSILFTKRVEHTISTTNYIHEVARNLKLIDDNNTETIRPVLFPSDNDFNFVKQYKSSSYICIAPASVWFTKQLPFEKWIDLIKLVHSFNPTLQIYLLGAPSDKEFCESLILQAGINQATNLAGSLSFLQTAALMKDANMNYVNDSAPLHIASSMNARVTVFYCSTIPAFGFGPLSKDSKIIEIETPLDCRPCGLHGHKACPKGHFKCGTQINLDFIQYEKL
jgi:ADP-heptose:LPS heptosyltransferase